MVILPTTYERKRLRTILAYKFIEAEYTIATPETTTTLFLPIDSRYTQILNFKVNSNLGGSDKFNVLSLGTDLSNVDILTNDTCLWYENCERGQIFDTELQAYTVNTKFIRPEAYKEYWHRSNLEGLYIYIDSTIAVDQVSVYAIYQDLDSVQ